MCCQRRKLYDFKPTNLLNFTTFSHFLDPVEGKSSRKHPHVKVMPQGDLYFIPPLKITALTDKDKDKSSRGEGKLGGHNFIFGVEIIP